MEIASPIPAAVRLAWVSDRSMRQLNTDAGSGASRHRGEPYLLTSSATASVETYFRRAGAASIELDLATATTSTDVIDAMKDALEFADWCGSNWDSIEDAFEEIRQAWTFPLLVVIRGLPELIGKRPHLGLQTIVRLDALEHAFSISGDQLIPMYVWDEPGLM